MSDTATARGLKSRHIVYTEDSYKTPAGTPAGLRLDLTGNTVNPGGPLMQNDTITGDRGVHAPDPDNRTVSGDLSGYLNCGSALRLLYYAMGAVDTTGTGPYEHVLSRADELPSFHLERHAGEAIASNPVERFTGLKVGQLQLSLPNQGRPTFTATCTGAGYSLESALLDAEPELLAQSVFHTHHYHSLSLGSTAGAEIRELTLTLNNGLDEDGYTLAGAGERDELLSGNARWSGQIVALFRSPALINHALENDELALEVVLRRGTGAGTLANEELKIALPKLRLAVAGPGVDGPQGRVVTLDFEAYGDPAITAQSPLEDI